MFPPAPEDWNRPIAAPRRRSWPLWVAVLTAVAGIVAGAVLLALRLPLDDGAPAVVRVPPRPVLSPGSCDYVERAEPNDDGTLPGLPPPSPAVKGPVRATIRFAQGPVEIELFPDKAPCTVNSFVFLARRGFFDDTTCHRVTTRGIYVLQCGDPSGLGIGGPGYTMPEENLAGAHYVTGTVALARTTEPHSGGSQFFLVYDDSDSPPDYTVFGRITSGLEVVQAIGRRGVAPGSPYGPDDGRPVAEVRIRTVTVTP